ncbi:TonB-dependent receptor [Caulobacter sp. BP25]|uniref:TonB-dependent receptor n=1 Tax=Caulobacter sp. BP25 TaxID=2048900 RepID=UPI0013747709|nr:TonB-dependent receptor [Caulobacter sp. BP25]
MTTSLLAGLAAVAAPMAVVAVATAVPTMASAQDFTNGTLAGSVVDTTGKPVVGATISIQDTARGIKLAAKSGSSGDFRVSQIPIGTYSVSIAASGFDTYTDNTVAVRLGSVSGYTFTINPAGSVSEVVITGTRARGVDFDRTTTGLSIDVAETIERIPTARTLTALTLLAPQAVGGDTAFANGNGEALASIGGSSVAENVYYINGMNITDFRNFLGGSNVPFDFYRQVDVKTGGFSSEYGRSTGGAIIAVTKSGSNEWHGGANLYWQPTDLYSKAPNTLLALEADDLSNPNINLNKRDRNKNIEGNIWASGAIIEDRLFFYAFYNPRNIKSTSYTSGTNGSATSEATSATYSTTTRNDPFYGGKIDFNLTDKQRFEFTMFHDGQSSVETQGVEDITTRTSTTAGSGKYNTSNTNTLSGGDVKILRYTGNFTDWFSLSALWGKSDYKQTVAGDLDGEASVFENGSVVRGNPNLTISQGADSRENIRVDGDVYFSLLGRHHIKVGVDQEKMDSSSVESYSGGIYYRYYAGTVTCGVGTTTNCVRVRVLTRGGAYSTKATAWYVQDAWDLTDRLSAQLGVRAETFQNKNAEGEIFVEAKNQIAPRIGLTYDVLGDRSTKVSAFFGRYYLPIAANTNIRMAGNELFTQDWYTYSSRNATTLVPVLSGSSRLSETLSDGIVPASTSLVSQNLDPQYQDEYILGFQHTFKNDIKVGVNLVYRDLKNVLEDFDTGYIFANYCKYANIAAVNCNPNTMGINGSGYVLLNPGKDLIVTPDPRTWPFMAGKTITIPASVLDIPKAKREYTALEFTFDRPWDGKWALAGSYVWSESKGNYEGGVKSDNGQVDPGLTQDFDEPGWTDNAYGYLPNHRAHVIKAYGSYQLTDRILLGANGTITSPRKYGCLGVYPYGDGRASSTTVSPFYCGGKPTPRGSQFQGEWIYRFDMSASYDVPISDTFGKLQVRADVFNVFNFKHAQDFNEAGEVALNSPSLLYRLPSSYQTPRYVRIGVSYSF